MRRLLTGLALLALLGQFGCASLRPSAELAELADMPPTGEIIEPTSANAFMAMFNATSALPAAERDARQRNLSAWASRPENRKFAISGGVTGVAPGGAPFWSPPPRKVRISNPNAQPLTLHLSYGTSPCESVTVVAPAKKTISQELCLRSAYVTIEANARTIAPGRISVGRCYALGQFPDPSRWALDDCPS